MVAVISAMVSVHEQVHKHKNSQQDILQSANEVCSVFGDQKEPDYHEKADEYPNIH